MVTTFTSTDRLINESAAADILGWSKKTLQQRRWRGKPPPFLKIGGSVKYVERELYEFITSCASIAPESEVNRELK